MSPDLWQSAGLWDAVCLAVLLFSLLIGGLRGFVAEMASLLAWVLAFVAARWAAPAVQKWLAATEWMRAWSEQALYLSAFVLSFVVVLLLVSVLTGALRRGMQGLGLGAVDRVLGLAFGTLRALVLLWAATALIWSTPLHQWQWWQQSPAAAWLTTSLRQVAPVLPDAVRRWLPSAIEMKA